MGPEDHQNLFALYVHDWPQAGSMDKVNVRKGEALSQSLREIHEILKEINGIPLRISMESFRKSTTNP